MSTRSDETCLSEPVSAVTGGQRLAPDSSPTPGASHEPARTNLEANTVCESPVAVPRQTAPRQNDSGAAVRSVGHADENAVYSGPHECQSPRPFTWRELTGSGDPPQVCLRLGSTRLSADGLRGLRIGAVVRLNHSLDEPVEIFHGRHLLGYGRVVLVDGKLAVQVTVRRQPSRRPSA